MEESSVEYDQGFIDGIEEGKRQLQAKIAQLEEQLREGYHCSSFEMCKDAGEKYEKQIAQLEGEKKGLEKELEPYRAKPGEITHLEWLEGRVKDLDQALEEAKE